MKQRKLSCGAHRRLQAGRQGRKPAKLLAVTLAVTLAAPTGVVGEFLAAQAVYGAELETGNQSEAVSFPELREKWRVLLNGGDSLSQAGSLAEAYAAYVDQLAEKQWNAMIKLGDALDSGTDNRTCLFPDLPMTSRDRTGSSQITLTFDRLKAIALAYTTQGSKFYEDETVYKELIAALDLMIENHYSLYYACGGVGTGLGSGNHSFGNWYDWRIGTPRQLCDLLLMMEDELSSEQIDRYTAPIIANNKKVDTTGANRTWIANIFIQTGILRGDSELIEAGKAGVKDVFKFVETRDGFHEDGSFIQHNFYAYTGGYGKALLCTMAPMMYVLDGTEYEISYDDNCQDMFFDMIFEAYEPLIYGGRFMDMSREREISRIANQDSIPGRQAIRSIIMLLDVMPEELQERGYAMVKEWLSDEEVLAQVCIDPLEGYNEYYLPAGLIQKAVEIAESGIEARGSLVKHKRYGAMDRVVHLRDDFGFTVSMSSERIYNTEGTNDEGLRLWHIGDGLTYLYNDDKTYYSDHYWATVDHQRLPGTTVNRVPGRGKKEGYNTPNPYEFAGGTDLGEYGIAGMELQGVGDSKRNGAHSRKSWFFFDDEVAAVGSDIRSTLSGSLVETIVENRKINLDKSNTLTVNGEVQAYEDTGGPVIKENKAVQVTTVTKAGGKDVRIQAPLASMDQGQSQVTLRCKVKMPKADNFFALKLYGACGEGSEKNLMFLTMRNEAMVPRMSDGQDAYSAAAALSSNTWHDIQVDLNLADQTFQYYFDGKQITEGKKVTDSTQVDLTHTPFFQAFSQEELAAGSPVLTRFEIMTPGNGTGTILADDISVICNGTELFAADFEGTASGSLDAPWKLTQNDTAEGAGAKVVLEQETVIPEGADAFNGLHEDTQWIHLAGASENSDAGYYFPGTADIQGLRETRSGTWNLVNTYAKFTDDAEWINSFASFWFDHGEKPEKEKYSYVVLPGFSAQETADYNADPDIEILAQTEDLHAVREKSLGITGINFFEPGSFGGFTVSQPGSVMMQEKEDGIVEISFADPTQTAKAIHLKAALPITEVIAMDEGVTSEYEDGVMVFTAEPDNSPRGSAGESWHVTVRLGGHDNMFETMEPGTQPEHWTAEGGNAAATVREEDGGHVLEILSEGQAQAATDLAYPETGSSMISFRFKPVSGSGKVWLGDENEKIELLSFGDAAARGFEKMPLEMNQWHDIKVKVNFDAGSLQVMADGQFYGDPQAFEGSLQGFMVEMAERSEVRLDNLVVRPSVSYIPDAPKHLTYTAYGDTYVDLTWDKAEGDTPVYYMVEVNGETAADQLKDTSYKLTGLEPEETYEITVRAADDEANYSDASLSLTVTTLAKQNDRYVVNFDGYEEGDQAQNRWTYGGNDDKGIIRVGKAPEGNDNQDTDEMLTDIEYWNRPAATPSEAERSEEGAEEEVPLEGETFGEEEEAPSEGESFGEEEVPSEGETFGEEAAPSEGEASGEEEAPSEGETTGEEEAPAEGETSGEEEAPSEGKTTGEEEAPSKGESSGEEEAPAEGETSGEEEAPSEGETTGEEEAPSEGETSGEEEAPAEEETSDEENLSMENTLSTLKVPAAGTPSEAAPAATPSEPERVTAEEDKALYIYSGTSGQGIDKNVTYEFDKQTGKQTYELDVYFDESVRYTNFALIGSNGKQAVTMMVSDNGYIGYRAGDDPSTTKELLSGKIEEQWVHFVITADPETQRYSISADGTEKADLPFRFATDDISTLKINAPGKAIGGLYVDNIVLPADEAYGKWTVTALEDEFTEELIVPHGTSFDDLNLPEYVSVTVVDPDGVEASEEIRINWDIEAYNGNESGRQTIQGTLALPSSHISKISESQLRQKVMVEKQIPEYRITLIQSAGGTIESDMEKGKEGEDVTITASPDQGYSLKSWIINDREKAASDLSCTISLTEDITVSAVFEAEDVEPDIRYYKVEVPEDLPGGQILTSSDYAKEGTEITITVIPEPGYSLSWLKVGGKQVAIDADLTYTFILQSHTAVSGRFQWQGGSSDDSDSSSDDSYSSETITIEVGRVPLASQAPEAAYAVTGTWTKAGDQWQFRLADGQLAASRWACIPWGQGYEWFYFDEKSNMVTGWLTLNGQTFYLQTESDGNRGRMLTGTHQIDGVWYTFNTVSDGSKGALIRQ